MTALDAWTLAIAAVAFVLSISAFVWRIIEWTLSGSRIKVDTHLLITASRTRESRDLVRVRARNVGRLAVDVSSWGLRLPDGQFLSLAEDDGPHRLEPGQAVSWDGETRFVARTLVENGYAPDAELRASVYLGTGKTVVTKKRESVSLARYVNRVHFVVSSKGGAATLSIEHPKARQDLLVPVYPQSAVGAIAPMLEGAFTHYALQWERIMVPDAEVTDARCFYLHLDEVPVRIADPSRDQELARAALPFYQSEDLDWFPDRKPIVLHSDIDPANRVRSNLDDLCSHGSEKGITRLGSPPRPRGSV